MSEQPANDRPWIRCADQLPDTPQPVWCVRDWEAYEAMALGNGAFITRDGDYWRDVTHWMPRVVDHKPGLPAELIAS